MSQVIIFKQDNGVIAVVIPTSDVLQIRTIMEVAVKDVPCGKKFKIINHQDLPWHVPQEAWEIDDEDLNDGIGGESCEFSCNEEVEND